MNQNDTIGKRVAWARKQAGLSQQQLADAVGLSQSAIGNLEAGLRRRPLRIIELAHALNIAPDWLLTGKGEPTARLGVREPQAPYEALSAVERALVEAYRRLREKDQKTIYEQVATAAQEQRELLEEFVKRGLLPDTAKESTAVSPPGKTMHDLIQEASKQNPPPVPLPENVRSLKKERRIRLSRGSSTSPSVSHEKKKK